MFDSGVEHLGCRILSEPENVAAADPSEAPGAGNEQKAQRAPAPEQVGVGPFARTRLGLGEHVELQVASEVVGEDAHLLPRPVGAVVVGGTTSRANSPVSSARLFHWAPRPPRVRRLSMSSRRKATACLESWTFPGRFLRRRMWPVCARWATSG